MSPVRTIGRCHKCGVYLKCQNFFYRCWFFFGTVYPPPPGRQCDCVVQLINALQNSANRFFLVCSTKASSLKVSGGFRVFDYTSSTGDPCANKLVVVVVAHNKGTAPNWHASDGGQPRLPLAVSLWLWILFCVIEIFNGKFFYQILSVNEGWRLKRDANPH